MLLLAYVGTGSGLDGEQAGQRRLRRDVPRLPNAGEQRRDVGLVGEVASVDRRRLESVDLSARVTRPRLRTSSAHTIVDTIRPLGGYHWGNGGGAVATPYCRSGAGRSSRLRANPPTSSPLEAIGPRLSRCHNAMLSEVASSHRFTTSGVSQTRKQAGWSARPAPTAGASRITSMPYARSRSAGPMPDSSRRWGLATAPPDSSTS